MFIHFVDKAGTTAKAVAPPLPTELTTCAPSSLPHSVFKTPSNTQAINHWKTISKGEPLPRAESGGLQAHGGARARGEAEDGGAEPPR